MTLRSSVASRSWWRAGRLGALLIGCALAAACGQKGPLVLPAASPTPTNAASAANPT